MFYQVLLQSGTILHAIAYCKTVTKHVSFQYFSGVIY